MLKPMVKQNLEVASGAMQNYDYGRMAWDATKRFGTSFLKTPGNYISYTGINKMIGNLPCYMARGGIKYGEERLVPIFGQ